jgi:serine/threonine-protein kinase
MHGEARRRVFVTSLVFSSLWVLAQFINLVLFRFLADLDAHSPQIAWPWPGVPIALIGIAIGLGVAGAARNPRFKTETVLDLSLVAGVLQALLISIMTNWIPIIHPARVSWVAVIILLFPIIAPNTVKKTALAALAAATMDPLGLLIARARGAEIQAVAGHPMDAFTWLWAVLPSYLCAGLAVIPASIMNRMKREVAAAREMGSYRLGRRLGEGGMGEVYLATHRFLARPAAVKLIRPQLLGEAGANGAALTIQRFRREAEAAATLRSPHSIEIYDFGESGDHTFYCAMEYLDGMDLQRLVERFGPVPPERAVHLLRQACLSLGEAHVRGMVHRDVKPSNLFVARMGLDVDFLKVLDFGLVRSRRDDGSADPLVTAPRVVLGSPAYIPPEALLGGAPDARSDIYSLGCVGYWLLTGRLVFEGATASEILAKHVRDEPVPPSRLAEIPFPPDLDRIVLTCLAKDPSARPQSAEGLAVMLEACSFPTPWTQARAREWWDVHVPGGVPGNAERS